MNESRGRAGGITRKLRNSLRKQPVSLWTKATAVNVGLNVGVSEERALSEACTEWWSLALTAKCVNQLAEAGLEPFPGDSRICHALYALGPMLAPEHRHQFASRGDTIGLLVSLASADARRSSLAQVWLCANEAAISANPDAWRSEMRLSRFALSVLNSTKGLALEPIAVTVNHLLDAIRLLWLPTLCLLPPEPEEYGMQFFDHYYTVAASCWSIGMLITGVKRGLTESDRLTDFLHSTDANALHDALLAWMESSGKEATQFAQYQSRPWRTLQNGLRDLLPHSASAMELHLQQLLAREEVERLPWQVS